MRMMNEFEAQVLSDLSVLKNQMSGLMGDGSGGRIAELERRIEHERSEYDRLMRAVAQLYQSGALTTKEEAAEVFVEGTANLVRSENDTDRLRQLLKTLEETG